MTNFLLLLLLCFSTNHIVDASHHRRGPPSKGQLDENNDFSNSKGSYSQFSKKSGKKSKQKEFFYENGKGEYSKGDSPPSGTSKGWSTSTSKGSNGTTSKGSSQDGKTGKKGKTHNESKGGISSRRPSPIPIDSPTFSPIYTSAFPTPAPAPAVYPPSFVKTVLLHKFTIQYVLKDWNGDEQPAYNDFTKLSRATEEYLDIFFREHFNELYDINFIKFRLDSTTWTGFHPYRIQYGTEADFYKSGTLPSSVELDKLVVEAFELQELYLGYVVFKLEDKNAFSNTSETTIVSNKVFQKSLLTDLDKALSAESSTTVVDMETTTDILLALLLVSGNAVMIIVIYAYMTKRRKAQPPVKFVCSNISLQNDEISLMTDVGVY